MKTKIALNIFLLVAMLLSAGCGGKLPAGETPSAAPTTPSSAAQPSPTPTEPGPPPTPTTDTSGLQGLLNAAASGDLPPQVLTYQPDGSTEAALDTSVEVVFDQAMARESVEQGWRMLAPDGARMDGKFEWPAPERVRFIPGAPLMPATSYQVRVGEDSASQAGVTLGKAFTFRVTTLTPLAISQTFPPDGAADVDAAGRITVIFNRPVTALGVGGAAGELPQPLVFTPQVAGTGEWVNTSVYVFTPAAPLKVDTAYTARIEAGLQDSSGSPETALAQPYQWIFSTRPGAMYQIEADGDVYDPGQTELFNLSLVPKITLRFLQPMDKQITSGALRLAFGAQITYPLSVKWSEDGMSVQISPLLILPANTRYNLWIDPSARTADGGRLGGNLSWALYTIRLPDVVFTVPADGAQNVRDGVFRIQFASPMDSKSIVSRVKFTPPLKGEKNFYYSPGDNSGIFYGLEPSTNYTVQILPGMLDRFGNALNRTLTVRFSTAPRPPWANFNLPYIPVYRAGGTLEFAVQHINVQSLSVNIYRLTPQSFVYYQNDRSLFEPRASDLAASYQIQPDAALNQTAQQLVALKGKDGKDLPPGFYYMTLDSPGVAHPYQKYVDDRFMVINQAQLVFKNSPSDTLLWATDPQSGKPLAGMKIRVYGEKFKLLGEGVTDADGLLKLETPISTDLYDYNTRYALSTDAGMFAYASTFFSSGVYPEQFGIQQGGYGAAVGKVAYVYTERPLYRPGQPVYFKGVLRAVNDLAYSLADVKAVDVVISDFNQEVYRQSLPLSDFGTFDGELKLDSEAVLGSYMLEVRLPIPNAGPNDQQYQTVGWGSFTVAEYRKPEFQVSLSAAPENLLAGETITAELVTSYYSGGGLKEAKGDWTLRAAPFYFTPPAGLENFSFYDDLRDSEYDERFRRGGSKILAEGSVTTDAEGKAAFRLPANVQDLTGAQRLTLEVTVNDLTNNPVSAQAVVIAHRSRVYVGARPKEYVGQAGKPQTLELAAVDWNGQPVGGQTMKVEIFRRQWSSVQQLDAQGMLRWATSVEDIPAGSFADVAADARGRAEVVFVPETGGVYRAQVTALDAAGNPARTAAYLWVAGSDYVPWRQSNDRTFQLVVGKDSYRPGDTAEILIASPFQGNTYALVTVERGRIHQQKVVLLSGNSTLYRLPITAGMAPAAFVTVTVVKGVDATNPRPTFKVGMAKLNVSTEQQQLTVEVTPDRKEAGPGDTLTYAVKTSGADGQPVQAEVSLALSDLATLSLMDSSAPSLLDFFYAERALSVLTAVTSAASMDDYNAQLKEAQAAGEKGGSGGGKGDEGLAGVPEVRQDFPDTAFWQASLRTGADGTARVTVRLPDNLTTWRMDARAVTADTRVGQKTNDIISSRPLLVRPQTPRFFVAGDQAVLSAAVHNNTGADLSAVVSLAAQGLTLESPAEQTVELKNGAQALVSWRVSVPAESTRADLVFSAKGGGYQDASRPTLGTLDGQGIPIYRYEALETAGTAGALAGEGVRAEVVRVPQGVTRGELSVRVEPSLAAGMTAGLDYLEHYPYECTEQTVSRFLPNVLTMRALQAAGIRDEVLEGKLKEQVSTGLQRLYKRQNSDGGWGWWSGYSDELTSAYVTLGLVEARAAGYAVDGAVISRAVAYLNGLPPANLDGEVSRELRNRQAFRLYVLQRAGSPQVAQAIFLYEKREWLDLYARALLLQTLYAIDAQDPRAATLRSDLVSAAILSASGAHWEEQYADPWNWNSDTRSTAMILDALVKTDPLNPLAANAVRWLMVNRIDGRWRSTQETAWTLIALTDWMAQSGELKAEYRYAVTLNGRQLGAGSVNAQNLREVQTLRVAVGDLLGGEANRLAFARDGAAGNLYYTARLAAHLPAAQVKALDQGIVVSRRYYLPEDLKTPVTQVKAGQTVVVKLTIVAPGALQYLVVDDPLPAGLEAIDTTLKTSPLNEIPWDYDWEKVDEEGWGWWYFPHAELRDEKVLLSADYLPAGTYTYTYRARAVTAGVFQVIPPTAYEFYFPEVFGRGEGSLFTVK